MKRLWISALVAFFMAMVDGAAGLKAETGNAQQCDVLVTGEGRGASIETARAEALGKWREEAVLFGPEFALYERARPGFDACWHTGSDFRCRVRAYLCGVKVVPDPARPMQK